MNKEDAKEIVQKAYDLLSPIPEQEWTTGSYKDELGRCCVMGHWYSLTPAGGVQSNLGGAVAELTAKPLIAVNDGMFTGYPQLTPKARVIALLKDCLEAA